MCGITGVFDYGRADGSVSDVLISEMRDALWHRGPDGEGIFVSADRRVGLGHRRLAIVDPAHGIQPMYGSNAECLVYNGEIYNYPSLRRELEGGGVRFRTSCDTEVILHLYERMGERCVERLNGMFAFALWDPRRRSLFFARDRLGEKPFYWCDAGGSFVFASEIKSLLLHPAVERNVDESQIPPYLTNLVTSSPGTLFKGVHKLGPGTAGVCDQRGVRTWRYWSLAGTRSITEA